MKLRNLVLTAMTVSLLIACAEKPADTGTPGEPAVATPPPPPEPEAEPTDRDGFITHMHLHAIYLQELNAALAAGDLDAVQIPAYWLSRHQVVDGLPEGWAPYITGMRVEARKIEAATDVASAKAAAARLADNCRGCHEANGLDVNLFARSGD